MALQPVRPSVDSEIRERAHLLSALPVAVLE